MAIADPPTRDPRLSFSLGLGLAMILAAVGFGLSKIPYVGVIGPLCLALVVGMAWRSVAGVPAGSAGGIRFAAKTLLRLGIVLLGARLNFLALAAVGPQVLAIDLAVVCTAIPGLYLLGRRMGLSPHLSILMGVGTGICGASAVVAAGTVTKASEEDTTLGVALMGLLGTMGVFVYVMVGGFLGLGPQALGILTGASLHEVAQVVAGASPFGPVASDMAAAVKLTRVVLLAPVLVLVGAWFGRAHGQDAGQVKYSLKEPPIPYFVLGFLAVGAANTAGYLPGDVAGWVVLASVMLMATAMAAMGLNTDLAMLRKTGATPLVAGFAVFAALGGLVFGLLHLFGRAAA